MLTRFPLSPLPEGLALPSTDPAAPRTGTDGLAVLSLLLGLGSLPLLVLLPFGSCLSAPAGLIAGVVSLRRLRKNPGLRGKRRALVGVLLCGGYLALVTYVTVKELAAPPRPASTQKATP